VTVDVDVDQTQPGIATLGVDKPSTLRERKGETLPSAAGKPTEDGRLAGIAHDQFANAVTVEVCQPHAPVASMRAGEHGSAKIEAVQSARVFQPTAPVEVPHAGRHFAMSHDAGHSVLLENAETDAGFAVDAFLVRADELAGEAGGEPLAVFRGPDPSLANSAVGHYHVHESVVVCVEHADAVVLSLLVSQRVSPEKIVGQSPVHLAKVEELDPARTIANCVVDELDNLIVANPSSGVKREGVDSLFDHGGVDGRFHVADGGGVVWTELVLALPIVGNGRGNLPTEPIDNVGIGIVFHIVDEVAVVGNVLVEPLPAVVLEDQAAR